MHSPFCAGDKMQTIFLCSWHFFLYMPENSDHVQPVVVFCCKHNVTMRILNKIQLILESNLDFQGFINVIQTHPNPEVQPMVESWGNFVRMTKCSQFFCVLTHFCIQQKTASWFNHRLYFVATTTSRCEFGLGFLILVTLWIPRHVTTCVFLSISFQFLIQALSNCKR